MQRPRNGGPPVGRMGRRVLVPPPPPETPRPATGWLQPDLFSAARDYHRFDRGRHEDSANPWLVQARRTARTLGEVRGWTRWIASDVDRALVIVLSGHTEGETIRYSEIFPALRSRGLSLNRTAEVLDRMGLFVDNRVPSADLWLERKLDGVAPGIRRTVEQWARVLLDGGPRSEPRARSTARTYLNAIRPALLDWSTRHDHLREMPAAPSPACCNAIGVFGTWSRTSLPPSGHRSRYRAGLPIASDATTVCMCPTRPSTAACSSRPAAF